MRAYFYFVDCLLNALLTSEIYCRRSLKLLYLNEIELENAVSSHWIWKELNQWRINPAGTVLVDFWSALLAVRDNFLTHSKVHRPQWRRWGLISPFQGFLRSHILWCFHFRVSGGANNACCAVRAPADTQNAAARCPKIAEAHAMHILCCARQMYIQRTREIGACCVFILLPLCWCSLIIKSGLFSWRLDVYICTK